MDIKKIITKLKNNYVVAINTDTVPGLHAKANEKNGQKIALIKEDKHRVDKGFIQIGISIDDFDIDLNIITADQLKAISTVYAYPITWIVPAKKYIKYLTRKDKTMGIRITSDTYLRQIIRQTGTLISTSCNISGKNQFINNFKQVYYHQQKFQIRRKPSKIITINNCFFRHA